VTALRRPRRNRGRSAARSRPCRRRLTLVPGLLHMPLCGRHTHPLDDRLGLDGLVTRTPAAHLHPLARPLGSSVCRRATSARFAGLIVGDNTVRAVCRPPRGPMAVLAARDPEAVPPFASPRRYRFPDRCTCVNTPGGWREVRAVYLRQTQPAIRSPVWTTRASADAGAPHSRWWSTAAIASAHPWGRSGAPSAASVGVSRDGRMTGGPTGPSGSDRGSRRTSPGPPGCARHLPRPSTCTKRGWGQWGGPGGRGVVPAAPSNPPGSPGGFRALLTEFGVRARDVSGGRLPVPARRPQAVPARGRGRSIGSGWWMGVQDGIASPEPTGARWKVRRLEQIAARAVWIISWTVRRLLERKPLVATSFSHEPHPRRHCERI